MNLRAFLITLIALLFVVTSSSFSNPDGRSQENSLYFTDIKTGDGCLAQDGTIVTVHVVGWLKGHAGKGSKIISSYDRGKPISFVLGTDKVMPGWNEGVRGMKVGGERRIVVPPHLGYGVEGVADLVPPDTSLIFEIELLDVR
ncbi:FKBP-type peptidyl-prolyl cis-trans isomerase [Desulfoferrobacter suflitae]|uniref:FKBP-type peptidyl-prolyl cis-trans isomerase n=1 Tax=Desulfoferrobacter suflitae TaxID=2865782 RepID=UPI0021643901|nr:FKBP-type peptidyl-prolyl cis-trans isomerase [Desulfoferrobacter suflitae]MCK8601230.1 FKBP-type peptidyl-prolyl cis-trans isomerase [Desulfoferrobacter suflitae]